MTENWQDCFVADIASSVKNALVGGPFGSNLVSRDYVATGIPVIRGQNMGKRWINGDFVFVSNEKAKQLSPNTARPGDLIFTQRGTLGQVAIVSAQPHDVYIISQSQMKLTVNDEKVDSLFLYYVFKSPEQQEQDYIIRNAIQTGVPHTNLEHLRTTPLFLPPLPEQRAIAGILGALDDKIELNRRMNRTLESMARAVFRQWFVESEENDWEEKSLDEIADFLNGLALQKFPAGEGGNYLPVIKITQLRKNDTKDADKASPNIPAEYIIEDSDVLFSWSGSLEVVVWCGGKGALNQHLFKVTSKQYPKWFYYYWTKYHLPDFQEIAAGKATTMGHIQRHHLRDAKVLVPSDKELQEMGKIMSPILEKIISNEKESRTLASLRDTLLPKLMRGEVRVRGT